MTYIRRPGRINVQEDWAVNPTLPMEIEGIGPVRFAAFDSDDDTVNVHLPRRGDARWYYVSSGRRMSDHHGTAARLRNVPTPKQEINAVTTTPEAKPEQPATLLAAFTDRTKTGTYGPFTVSQGRVRIGGNLLVHLFNDTVALINNRARASIVTTGGNVLFDSFLLDLIRTKIKIEYVDSIADYLNPAKRFEEFVAGNGVPSGLTLSEEELRVPQLLGEIKTKFTELFTAPVPPYTRSTAPLDDGQKLEVKGSRVRRPNGGYWMALTTARKLFKEAKREWLANPATESSFLRHGTYVRAGGGNTPNIYGDRVVIGCQSIDRNQIEELATRLGWLAA